MCSLVGPLELEEKRGRGRRARVRLPASPPAIASGDLEDHSSVEFNRTDVDKVCSVQPRVWMHLWRRGRQTRRDTHPHTHTPCQRGEERLPPSSRGEDPAAGVRQPTGPQGGRYFCPWAHVGFFPGCLSEPGPDFFRECSGWERERGWGLAATASCRFLFTPTPNNLHTGMKAPEGLGNSPWQNGLAAVVLSQ